MERTEEKHIKSILILGSRWLEWIVCGHTATVVEIKGVQADELLLEHLLLITDASACVRLSLVVSSAPLPLAQLKSFSHISGIGSNLSTYRQCQPATLYGFELQSNITWGLICLLPRIITLELSSRHKSVLAGKSYWIVTLSSAFYNDNETSLQVLSQFFFQDSDQCCWTTWKGFSYIKTRPAAKF